MQQASMCPYLLCEWAPLEALPNHKHVEAGNLGKEVQGQSYCIFFKVILGFPTGNFWLQT